MGAKRKLKEILRRCGTPEELSQEIKKWGDREFKVAPFQERVLGLKPRKENTFWMEEEGDRLRISFRFKIRKLAETNPFGGMQVPLCLRPTVTVTLFRNPEEGWVMEKATAVSEKKPTDVVDFQGFEKVSLENFFLWIVRTQPGWEGEVTAYDDEAFLYSGEGWNTRVVGFKRLENLPVWMLPS